MFFPAVLTVLVAVLPPRGRCTPPSTGLTATAVLSRATAAARVPGAGGAMLHVRAQMIRELRYLSDRSYPPFDASISDEEIWFDPASGIERLRAPGRGGDLLWSGPLVTMVGGDSAVRAAPASLHGFARWQKAFDAWAVIAEWTQHGDATVEGRCPYRNDVRIALRRPGFDGDERLLFSEGDGLPVAMLRTERSYFFGPERVEYLYMNWDNLTGALYPMTTIRVVDGKKDRLRSVRVAPGETSLVPRDSAPRFPVFTSPSAMAAAVMVPPEPFWTDRAPDTVRVGPRSFLLVNSSFTSAVVLAADTVFILDATQGERRARQDSIWIGRLFPGKHPLVFVAATGIWPHIAGLRYWVANGATVIAHPATRPLVDAALSRRWTAAPDLLERRRATLHVRIDTVRRQQARAGGALRVFAVDGAASEGVLAAYMRDDAFVWASDRVQDISNPSLYVTELWQTVLRQHLTPRWTSGPHLGVIQWQVVERLATK